jgi:Zn-dependent protease with chaperone function
MRTILLCLLAFSLTQYNSFGQNSITFNKPIEIILNKNYSQELKKGSKIVISSVEKKTEASGYYEFNYIGTDSIGNQYYLKENLVEDAVFPINPSIEQVWEIGLIKNKVYKNLLLNGYQYDIRSELNKEAESYLNILHDKNLFFSDAYLEDYLYKILNKIHKGYLTDKRPGNLSVRVIKDATPNAIALSNGCILLTTGLLSCLNSESQLAGILAHEVTHFVNDHHILSNTKEQARLKRAEFWTAVVTGLAVASDVYLATNNQNYTYGLLSPTTAIAATLISESIVERMGIKYSHNQEFEADFTAKSVLVSLGLDDYSFATALYLLEKNFYLSGNYSALIGGKTHPSIQERVYRLGFFINRIQ